MSADWDSAVNLVEIIFLSIVIFLVFTEFWELNNFFQKNSFFFTPNFFCVYFPKFISDFMFLFICLIQILGLDS